jgi:hypothetical protein
MTYVIALIVGAVVGFLAAALLAAAGFRLVRRARRSS